MITFWHEVFQMDLKRHGIRKENIWIVALLFLVLSIIGVFTLPCGVLRTISIVILVLVGFFELWGFFIELPAKKWKQDISNLHQQLVYWESFLEQELKKVLMSLKGRVIRWDFEGLKAPEPYFDVYFQLTNTCIFPLHLKGITGFIQIAGNQCLQSPQVDERWGIEHGETLDILLKQPISPQTAKILSQNIQDGKMVSFNLKSLTFDVEVIDPKCDGYKPRLSGKNFDLKMAIIIDSR